MSHNIPFEIQIEILKQAHVKSLIRFRSVSKLWKSLIDSFEFIAGYCTRKTQPCSLFLRYIDDFYDWYPTYVSVNNDTFTQQQDLTLNVSARMEQICCLHVIGYSRGLLCLHAPKVKGGILVLWNPSIRRSVSIRGSFKKIGRSLGGIGRYPYSFDLFGFVVCPVTNEPTIVKLVYPWKAEIFTLSSNRWTIIQCNKPRECESVSLHDEMQVVIDSCIYRVAYETVHLQRGHLPNTYMIVSFDLNAKEFKAIDLPDTIRTPLTSSKRFIISKLKGSLVVIVPHSEIQVWKMEPDCCFTQLFTINRSCITNIVGFRKDGALVVETKETHGECNSLDDTQRALEVYDPRSKQITDLGMSGESRSFFISSYKETLLLLDHSDICVYPEIN